MEENKYAFPIPDPMWGGMTLRAWIAGQAAAAIDANDEGAYWVVEPNQQSRHHEDVAKRAVALADAVIEELGRE